MIAARRALALGAAILLGACAHTAGPPPADFLGPLQLPLVTGDGHVRASELRGEVVLVSFFATWCAPCLVQLPDIRGVQEQHRGEGLRVIAVGMDLEARLVLEPFARGYELPFPVVAASDDLRDGRTAYGRISALPTTVLIRRDGTVARSFAGTADRQQLERWIREEISR